MELLCKVCNKFVIDNYTIDDPNLDEIDKMLNDYVTSYNKNFDIYAIRCQFFLVFDNNFKIYIETDYFFNIGDFTKTKNCFLYSIDYYRSLGYGSCNINKKIVKTISDKHWMSHKIFIQYPMQRIERQINMVFDRYPELINTLSRTTDHPISGKSSHEICTMKMNFIRFHQLDFHQQIFKMIAYT